METLCRALSKWCSCIKRENVLPGRLVLCLSIPLPPFLFKEVQPGSPGLTRTQGNPSSPASLELGLQVYIAIPFCFFKLNGSIHFSIQLRQPLPVLTSAHIRQNVVTCDSTVAAGFYLTFPFSSLSWDAPELSLGLLLHQSVAVELQLKTGTWNKLLSPPLECQHRPGRGVCTS